VAPTGVDPVTFRFSVERLGMIERFDGGIVSAVESVGGRLAWLQPVSIQEQANQHHNLLRYNELQRLRQGMPNRYLESKYRH
jgi:hypothetical protein